MQIITICLTTSDGLCKSMTRLWMRIWYLSQVFEPSPHGVLRVVILNTFVGILTGPKTLSSLSLAPLIKSPHTFSRLLTFKLVNVILIRWMDTSSACLPSFWYDLKKLISNRLTTSQINMIIYSKRELPFFPV